MIVVKRARQKHAIHVVCMENIHFLFTSDVEEVTIVNRKKTNTDEKVKWLRMKHISHMFDNRKDLFFCFTSTVVQSQDLDMLICSRNEELQHRKLYN